jgi:hypothetical protein
MSQLRRIRLQPMKLKQAIYLYQWHIPGFLSAAAAAAAFLHLLFSTRQ